MATGGSSGNSNIAGDSVSKLTCAICLENYRRPKLLPCYHTFCQSCLQGLAGSSSFFHCPSCRKLITLPAGGVRDLQNNFYIEEDVCATSSPQRRLCDVCTEDNDATHTCMQCKQKLCSTCRKCHDALRGCRGHTVVPLTSDDDQGCGKGGTPSHYGEDRQEVEMCVKHPDQRLLLHCNKCQADICIQCKLTQHEGHPTADLADRRAEGKARLRDMVDCVTQQMKEIDHLLVVVDDRRKMLQQQQQNTEQDFKGRADMLFQWVSQALDEALSSVQSTCHQMDKTLQDQAEQLRNNNLRLQAQRDHMMRVLTNGKEVDIVSMETQLSSSTSDNADVKQIEKELTMDIPTLHVNHNTTALNHQQLRAFVGVLDPVEQASCSKDASESVPSTSIPTEHSGRAGSSSVADRSVGVRQKKAPKEFIYSKEPKSYVLSMCSISHSRLWVMCSTALFRPVQLKLFDVEGKALTTVQNVRGIYNICTLCDDIALGWSSDQQFAILITPDGTQTSYDMGIGFRGFTTCGQNDNHYMTDTDSEKLYRVKFGLHNKNQPNSTESQSGQSPKSPGNPDFSNQLTRSEPKVVFDVTPSGRSLQHVSAGGRYFAFTDFDKVEVYDKPSERGHRLVSSYTPKNYPYDVRFCQIDGQELLLVAVLNDGKVHVVDHTEGCRFVRYLDTTPVNLYEPCRLATDVNQHLWIGCRGGKVVRVDL